MLKQEEQNTLFLLEKVEEKTEQVHKFPVLEEEQPEERNQLLVLPRVLPEVKYEEETVEFLLQMLEKM